MFYFLLSSVFHCIPIRTNWQQQCDGVVAGGGLDTLSLLLSPVQLHSSSRGLSTLLQGPSMVAAEGQQCVSLSPLRFSLLEYEFKTATQLPSYCAPTIILSCTRAGDCHTVYTAAPAILLTVCQLTAQKYIQQSIDPACRTWSKAGLMFLTFFLIPWIQFPEDERTSHYLTSHSFILMPDLNRWAFRQLHCTFKALPNTAACTDIWKGRGEN